jgi:hypothetical protein
MMRKSILAAASVAFALVAAAGTMAASHDDDRGPRSRRRLTADLKGIREVPVVSTSAHGSFRAVINRDETEIGYRLDYSDLEGTVTQAHIHVGDHHTSGGISVWLCGTTGIPTPPGTPGPAGTPTCGAPGGPGAEAEGVITAANIVGPATQGIGAPPPVDPDTEFAQLIKLLRSGLAYANVHSTMSPGGEIRGQIKVDD